MPLLDDPGHQEMVACLQKITTMIKKPSAIVVVSAHWEEGVPTITAAAMPSLIYDYFGFPDEAYKIQYPCTGEPNLASRINDLLKTAGIVSKLDSKRGFDHGLFVPLKIMYPQADIPCVQLSLVNTLDAAEHVRLGQSIQDLMDDDMLVIGSGFSFHNMQAFFAPETRESKGMNESFERWLRDTCSNPHVNEHQRAKNLIDWTRAPGARFCHPREEHLLPLHVCYGLAERPCSDFFEMRILNKKASMILW